jgi:transposase-like protein
MSEVKKRKIPPAELKAKIGLEAIRGLKTLNEIAQEYGVHPVQVGQYKKMILTQSATLFDAKRGPKPVNEHAEPERLYSEIGKLKMEADWLKKKLGISQ